MIALIVIGSILLLIIILLALSVTIELDYDRTFCYKVKYLFFTLAIDPESEKRKKKRKKKTLKKKRKEEKKNKKQQHKLEKKQRKQQKKARGKTLDVSKAPEKSTEQTDEKLENSSASKPTMADKHDKPKLSIDLIRRIFGRASPHIKRILKHIRIYNVYIDFVIGGDDAAKVAINYGKMNAIVNGGLELLSSMITLKVEEVVIEADFDKEKSDYFAHAKAKLRLSTLLHSGIWGFFAILAETRAETTAPQNSKKS